VDDGRLDAGAVGALARQAEELGYGAVWVSELTTAPMLDPLLVLAHAAATTDRVQLGLGVVLGPLHVPLRLAGQLASLDRLSGGRVVAGIGLGSKPEVYARHGLSPARRLRRHLDGIDLVRRLLDGDRHAYDNGLWALDEGTPALAPAGRVPLVLGARSEIAVRRAARLADGWLASGSAPLVEVRGALAHLRGELDLQGRDPAGFVVAKRAYLAIADDGPAARARLRGWFAAAYGNPDLADGAVVGSVSAVVDHLQELRALGFGHLLLNPVFDEADQLTTLAEALGLERDPTPQPT
jgi:alkanesulfonate monooxygenase SsuD/methylene tetrahydromethanopterin reductase-like flavin-dependent oxidoreductase (luciferase family)